MPVPLARSQRARPSPGAATPSETAPRPASSASPVKPAAPAAKPRHNWFDDYYLAKEGQLPPRQPLESYRTLGVDDLAKEHQLPRCIRTRMADWIDNALYHPTYGYFSRNVVIFQAKRPIPFNDLLDNTAVLNHVEVLYEEHDAAMDAAVARPVASAPTLTNPANATAKDGADGETVPQRKGRDQQTWHTPVEMFHPYYGQALARYFLERHAAAATAPGAGHGPLVVYEAGAGNGTLMADVLDYVAATAPAVYATMEYHVIEISGQLRDKQRARAAAKGHTARVAIHASSVLDMHGPPEHRPCFVVGCEIIDNLAHDLVVYDAQTLEPYQGVVLVDEDNNFEEAYEPLASPDLVELLEQRAALGFPNGAQRRSWWDRVRAKLPLAPNVVGREYLPTRLWQLLKVLHRQFPQHRIVLTDFDQLPGAVPGHLGPVVQTRHNGEMVPCQTPLVLPGWFDIFFPTDFTLMQALYHAARPSHMQEVARDAPPTRIVTQTDFLRKYGDLKATQTSSGENPLTAFYQNVRLLLS